ncbi:MAG: DegV family protein [Oscillospiraceae bacterium]|nr:DegV family protein [Oscillospiraceae bacterium]
MKKFVILADATCDLGEDLQQKYDIRVIPGHITLPDKTDIPSFLKWERYTREQFYAELKKNPTSFTTAPANVQEFANAYEEIVADGTQLLVMTISSGISGTYNFACQAKKLVVEKYPDAKITCVDSLRFGPGFGLMAVYASILRDEGRTMEEVAAWLEENKNRFHQAGWLDDLSFVAKQGRLTHAKAFLGTLAGVKPIGEFDYNGMTTVIGKAKGAKAAYAALLQYIDQTIENPAEQIIFVAHTNRYPQAVEFQRMIQERFQPKEVCIKDVFPSCGINIGPGLMAAYYVGKPISADLSEERAILDKALNGNG